MRDKIEETRKILENHLGGVSTIEQAQVVIVLHNLLVIFGDIATQLEELRQCTPLVYTDKYKHERKDHEA